jgi:hypothetical protein
MALHLWKPIKDLLTAKDGDTYAPSRVYWSIASIQFVFNSAWALIALHQQWDPVAYGTGMSAILVAGGVGVWVTRKTEPGQ